MTNLPLILVTNDDGVHAPGIKHLWKSIADIAEVVVVAPAFEQSAVSVSITLRRPLNIEKVEWSNSAPNIWSVSGTPADCVKLAIRVILPRIPQLIISGINRGNNSGRNVLYSGTVGAVIEGTLHNIPGIALSIADFDNPAYSEVEKYIPSLLHYILKHPSPAGTFMNINFPEKMKNMKGIQFTKQGKEYWKEDPEQRQHPAEGNSYYWLGAKLAQCQEQEDCDVTWLRKDYATVVPIHIHDLTDHNYIEKHKQQFNAFVHELIPTAS